MEIGTLTPEGVAVIIGSFAALVVASWIYYWYTVGRHEDRSAEEVGE